MLDLLTPFFLRTHPHAGRPRQARAWPFVGLAWVLLGSACAGFTGKGPFAPEPDGDQKLFEGVRSSAIAACREAASTCESKPALGRVSWSVLSRQAWQNGVRAGGPSSSAARGLFLQTANGVDQAAEARPLLALEAVKQGVALVSRERTRSEALLDSLGAHCSALRAHATEVDASSSYNDDFKHQRILLALGCEAERDYLKLLLELSRAEPPVP